MRIEQARMAGLVHDIGRLLILAHSPERFRAIGAADDDLSETELLDREAELLGTSHDLLGAHVLRLWRVDPVVIDATRWHHRRAGAEGPARRIVDAMAAIAAAERGGVDPPGDIDPDLINQAAALSGAAQQPFGGEQ